MRTTLRTGIVAVLAAVLVVSGVATAFAARDDTTDAGTDLEAFRAERLAEIDEALDTLQARLDALDGRDGVWAEQMKALWTNGITILEVLSDDVASAETVAEIRALSGEAKTRYETIRRIRGRYAHVTQDLERFGATARRLDRHIAEAADLGADTSEASAEHAAALTELDSARLLLATIDPDDGGEEILADLRESHALAHAGNRHLREARSEVVEALREWFAGL
jgi:hypothetical protein